MAKAVKKVEAKVVKTDTKKKKLAVEEKVAGDKKAKSAKGQSCVRR